MNYTIEELVQLKQAGFSADEIMTLSGTKKETPVEEVKIEEPVPVPVETVKEDAGMKEMLEAFKETMNEQMEAFTKALQASNIHKDSGVIDTVTASDVVAQIISPNGQRKGK